MDKNFTEIIIVLDRSGSMQSIKSDMEGGLNAFFEEQKEEPGRATVTLAQFDDQYEVVYSGKDLKDVPEVCINPRGHTALLDAVGKTINIVGERLANTPETDRPGRVIFVTITDGQENSSSEFTSEQVKALIEHQTKKYDWCFVYLGANQDGFAVGSQLGYASAGTYVATAVGTEVATKGLSRGVKRFRSGGKYDAS